MRRSDLGDLPQLVARRRIETVAAAIISVPPALHETVPLEVVDGRRPSRCQAPWLSAPAPAYGAGSARCGVQARHPQ
jgi:hypothetical protein